MFETIFPSLCDALCFINIVWHFLQYLNGLNNNNILETIFHHNYGFVFTDVIMNIICVHIRSDSLHYNAHFRFIFFNILRIH